KLKSFLKAFRMIRPSFTWTGDVLLNKRTAHQAGVHNEIGPSKARNAPRSRHTSTAGHERPAMRPTRFLSQACLCLVPSRTREPESGTAIVPNGPNRGCQLQL